MTPGVPLQFHQQPLLSHHASARLRQRGMRPSDIELIRRCGEPVADGYVVTNKAIARLRAQLQRLERLCDVAVIEVDDVIVTVYRADRRRIKRLKDERR